MKILYTAHGSATGGREGQAATDTGNVKLVLNTPKELGGGGTPPEGAVIMSGKEADMDRILRVRLLAADGTELSIPSRSSSTSDGETIMVIEPSEPPPLHASRQAQVRASAAQVGLRKVIIAAYSVEPTP